MNNSACICYKKKVFCEKFCFCECCNNIFKCRCNICDLDCPCLNFSRECSDCECSSCSNNNLLENKTKATFVDESTIAGYGLFAGEDILANEFVIEYIGEVITNEETERRGVFYEEKKLSYLFNLNQKGDEIFQTIDATKFGNKARFINHSSNPNLCAKNMQVNGTKRIGFYAIRNIIKGEEFFFDYNYNEEFKKAYNIKD